MYGNEQIIDMRGLVQHVKKLDEDQFSKYEVGEAYAFWKMFNF